jgi:hypothetical protein
MHEAGGTREAVCDHHPGASVTRRRPVRDVDVQWDRHVRLDDERPDVHASPDREEQGCTGEEQRRADDRTSRSCPDGDAPPPPHHVVTFPSTGHSVRALPRRA